MEATDLIYKCIEQGNLLCLTVNQERRKHISFMCRILNYESDRSVVVVYDVDQKQVQSYKINEIDELCLGSTAEHS